MEFPDIFKNAPIFALAPMANVTNIPFRLVCREFGADLAFTEMLSTHAISYENEATIEMARVLKEERPCAIQIMGPDEKSVKSAIIQLESLKDRGLTSPDFYDINLGCPSKNILRSKSGAYLLQSPQIIENIVACAVRTSTMPISCKARLGLNGDKILQIAKAVETGGAGMLTIHARTAAQGYSGKAKWESVRKAKDACGIFILCNGDIKNPTDAKEALAKSCADGVMIGRGAMANPAIFQECKSELRPDQTKVKDKSLHQSSAMQFFRFDFFEKYCRYAEKYGLNADIPYARIFATELTAGIKGGAQVRRELNNCKSIGCIKEAMLKHPEIRKAESKSGTW